jgi:hypothetical protein
VNPAGDGVTEQVPTVPVQPSAAPVSRFDPSLFDGATMRVPHVPAPARNPRTAVPSVYVGGPAAPKRTLRDILEATARAHPRAAAIDDGHQVLDYAALLREVDALGAMLSASGIGHRDRIGIRVPSGTADLYVSILATLSIGAAYVPVDADDPDDRADMVFGEAGVCAVIGAERAVTLASTPPKRIGPRLPGLEDDAWIIFTSGSTGKPKGVAVSHRSAAAFVDAEARLFLQGKPLGPRDRGARRPVRRLRRLLRGDVAGLAARRLPGACAALARPLRCRPRRLAGREPHLGGFDRADAGCAVAQRAAARHPAADPRRRGLPGEARAPTRRGVHRGLEHLRPHRDHRRRLRRADAGRRAGAHRPAARRLAPRRRRS